MTIRISLASQIKAVEAIGRAPADTLRRAGLASKTSEAETLREHLAAAVRTLEAIADHEDEVRAVLRKPMGKGDA